MKLLNYAKSELNRIPKDEDGMQDAINNDILQIVEIFSNQGHSGFSASYAIRMLNRLLRFKPISPLTGEDDEWGDVGRVGVKQNKRCSSVFKEEDGTIKDIDAVIVSDNGGISWFSSGMYHKKDIQFPYAPPVEPEKVYIEWIDEDEGEYEDISDQPKRIEALRKRKLKERE